LSGSPIDETRASARKPRIAEMARCDQPLGYQSARLSPTSGTTSQTVRQRDEIEHSESRSGILAMPCRAQLPRNLDQRHEHDARRAQVAEPGQIIVPVRIDHRRDLGQRPADLVVIEDDDVAFPPRDRAETPPGCWCRNRP
jgi:hypothetical protein